MRYPIRKNLRISLVKLYYELCIMPDVEPRLIRGWTDMFTRLLGETPHAKRKLEAKDMSLPWEPLWSVVRKELLPKKRLHDASYEAFSDIWQALILNLILKAQSCECPPLPGGKKQAILSSRRYSRYA